MNMSGSWSVLGGKKTPDRRSSSSGQMSNCPSVLAASGGGARIDYQKRPLMSMLSEDGGGSRHLTPQDGQQSAGNNVRQSFLSKLTTRSDSKPSSLSTTINENQPQQQQQGKATNQGKESFLLQEAEMIDHNNNNDKELSSSSPTLEQQQHGTECDKNNYKPKNDLEQIEQDSNSFNNNNNNNNNKPEKGNDRTEGGEEDETKRGRKLAKNKEERADIDGDDDDDDDNQVIPCWPSKSDAASKAINSEFIQHKVYSLKDYSQVASPMNPLQPINYNNNHQHNHHHYQQQQQSTSENNNNNSKQLNKSFSQDRKIKANTKRLSECLYLSTSASATSHPPLLISGSSPHQSEQLLPSGDRHQAYQKQHDPSNPTTGRHSSATASVGGLLPNAGPHTALLGGESRIDRMRKLFVSPMSLRSSSSNSGSSSSFQHGGKASGSSSAAALRGAGHQQRLSFQSGASSMLNKPQNLMHAMYRTGHGDGGGGARRSPMRSSQQEQANKSFRVYGCPLQMANNMYPITCFGRADIYKQQPVPYVLARLCNYIEENSSHLTHEGIFRVSGNARLMVKLRTLFDHLGDAPLESESVDVATSASMLKMYLRELPEPLIPIRMNYYFITLAKKYSLFLASDSSQSISGHRQPQATSTSSIAPPKSSSMTANNSTANMTSETTISSTSTSGDGQHYQQQQSANKERQRLAFSRDLTKLVRKLPIENYNLLKYLACFLYRISLKQQYNKMCAEALGIVFGPNIFRIRNESYKGLKEQELSNQIMASIISNYRSIFDSDITDPLGNLVLNPEIVNHDNGRQEGSLMMVVAATATVSTGAATAAATSTTGTSLADDHGNSGGKLAPLPKTILGGDDATRQPATESMGSLGATTATSVVDATAKSIMNPAPRSSPSKACCPVHCVGRLVESADDIARPPPRGSHVAAHSELRVCDLLGEIDDDDDDEDDEEDEDGDCDDEGESYTPSSTSDSYCSSMDSETIETSSCANNDDDHREDDEEFGGEHVDGELDMASPRSSSECASDTSYTPTSSHTDSDGMPDDEADEADESLYGENSSSFESSLSIGGGGANKLAKNPGELTRQQQQTQTTCRVCERRASAHLDRMANGELISRVCDDTTATNRMRANVVLVQQIEEIPETENDAQTAAEAELAPPRASPLGSVGGVTAKGDDDDGDGDDREEAIAAGTEFPKSGSGCLSSTAPVAASGHSKRQPTLKSGIRLLNFSRRRSSSASSLGRVRHLRTSHNRIHQTNTATATPTRTAAAVAVAAAQPFHGARAGTRSNRGASERSSRARHGSSGRRAKSRGHSIRRSILVAGDGDNRSGNRNQQQRAGGGGSRDGGSSHHVRGGFIQTAGASGTARSCSRRRSDRRNQKQQRQMPSGGDRHGMNFANWRGDSLAESNHHWVAPGSESYFLLRSFNSDETLLRSYSRDQQARLDTNYARNRPRRFSGIDAPQSTFAYAPTPPPGQIDQIFEEDRLSGRFADCTSQIIHHLPNDDEEDDPPPPAPPIEQSSSSTFVGASFVSLLDHKLIGFRKSDVSIDEEPLPPLSALSSIDRKRNYDDCIWVQVRATKQLIRVMRRLQRFGCNYTADLEQLVRKLSNEPQHGYGDDCTACEVDHLSALSLMQQIESHLSSTVDAVVPAANATVSESTTKQQFDIIVNEKINLLKQRQADLRAIRDHYWRIHAGSRGFRNQCRARYPDGAQNQGGGGSQTIGTQIRSKSETGILGSGSGGGNHPVTGITAAAAAKIGRSRKLSAPNKQQQETITTQQVSCSSSASSLADNTTTDSRQIQGPTTKVCSASGTFGRAIGSQQGRSNCKFGSLCPIEFVFNIEKQLAFKRHQGARLVKLNDMTMDQLMSEKLELQKNLLRYEHWFGRPTSRLEFSLVGHIYERYRAIKTIKLHRDHEKEHKED